MEPSPGLRGPDDSERPPSALQGIPMQALIKISLSCSALLLLASIARAGGPVGPTFDIDSVAPNAIGEPTLVWNDTEVLVIYRASPEELMGRYVGVDGSPAGPPFLIRDTFATGQIGPPSVGVLKSTVVGERFVVTWSREGNVAEDREIEFMLLTPGVSAAGTVVPLTVTGSAIEDIEPQVAPWASGDTTIVWNRVGEGIQGAQVSSNGGGIGTIEATYAITTNGRDSAPDVVRSPVSFNHHAHLVVWHRDNIGPKQSLRAHFWEGQTPSAANQSFEAYANNDLAIGPPALASSDDRDYFLVWDQIEPIGGAAPPRDVLGRRIFFPSPIDDTPRLDTVQELANTVNGEEFAPDVAFAGDSYAVILEAEVNTVRVLRLISVDRLNGHVLDTDDVAVANEFQGCSIASRRHTASGEDQTLIAWGKLTVNGEIEGRFAVADGGFRSIYTQAGCEVLGGVPALSSVVEGNPFFRMEIWHGEPGGVPYMLISDQNSFLTIGSAVLVPDLLSSSVFFGGNFDNDGYTGVEITLPPGLSGITFFGQWLTLSPGFQCTGYAVGLSDGFLMRVD